MKKILASTVVFALLLLVLAGCQSAYAAHKSTDPTQTPATSAISREAALEIALQDAGLTAGDVRDLEVEKDRDRGEIHYDVDFEKDGREYDYEIHAETGEILNKETPTVAPETVPQNTVGPMLREEAAAIALAHAGLTKDQVRDLDVERDDARGTPRYEVDFEAGGWEYEYEIHAETGEILRSEKERD